MDHENAALQYRAETAEDELDLLRHTLAEHQQTVCGNELPANDSSYELQCRAETAEAALALLHQELAAGRQAVCGNELPTNDSSHVIPVPADDTESDDSESGDAHRILPELSPPYNTTLQFEAICMKNGKLLPCPLCDKEFKFKFRLTKHLNKRHCVYLITGYTKGL